MQRRILVKLIDKWQQKVPLAEREANWAKHWSKWADKTREQVIEMTNHLKPMSELERMYKEQQKRQREQS